MATFIRPEHAIVAGCGCAPPWTRSMSSGGTDDLVVKIGIHEGPCLAVMLNERQDYFGQTVNIAARVQAPVDLASHPYTGPVIDAPRGGRDPGQGGDRPDSRAGGAAGHRRQDRQSTKYLRLPDGNAQDRNRRGLRPLNFRPYISHGRSRGGPLSSHHIGRK